MRLSRQDLCSLPACLAVAGLGTWRGDGSVDGTQTSIIDNINLTNAVPEPGSLALTGLGGIFMMVRHRK